MKWFANWKLAWKFAVFATVLLFGFAAIAIGYAAVLSTANTASREVESANNLGGLIDEIEIAVQKAHSEQRQLRLTNKLDYLEKFDETMGVATDYAKELKPFLTGEKEIGILTSLEALMETYRSTIYTVAESQIAIGLDPNSGYLGEIRTLAHRVEAVLREYKLTDIMVGLLSLRRHEKDYLARRDDKYVKQMNDEQENIQRLIKAVVLPGKTAVLSKDAAGTPKGAPASDAAPQEELRAELEEDLARYHTGFHDLVAASHAQEQDLTAAESALQEMEPLLQTLKKLKTDRLSAAANFATSQNHQITAVFVTILIVITVFTFLVLWLIFRGVTKPVARLQNVVGEVAGGNYAARAELGTHDELGNLGDAFDRLLEERVAYLAEAQDSNERLNNSVIDLLQAVSRLSNRDLTVAVPVKEDVTGPVADALNLLTNETAKVLRGVTEIADEVARASSQVKNQSDTVVLVTADERQQVEQTVTNLVTAAESMQQIAVQAQQSNESADQAIAITQQALELVDHTVNGIGTIRDTIRETEKRIKRLGERSQEITGTVSLINNIAERTHILALNASMHAASAGEAGRGFAVVADEVQRLAENAREATSEIASLVNNIQVETADTVTAMNQAITQVVEGTQLAEQAGGQMKETQKATAELVALVQRIASSSQEQAKISRDIADRSVKIRESTDKTRSELDEQAQSTTRLVDFAEQLVTSVRVFKLPEAAG